MSFLADLPALVSGNSMLKTFSKSLCAKYSDLSRRPFLIKGLVKFFI